MVSRLFGSLFGGAVQHGVVEQGSLPSAEDELELIARSLDSLRSAVRRSGNRLPGLISSQLRQIDDLLRLLLEYVAANGASTEQKVLLESMITNYLPSPLRAYLAASDEERGEGSEVTAMFAQQLRVLEETARDLDHQVRIGAVSELSVHARFLEDKFGPSLRLDGN